MYHSGLTHDADHVIAELARTDRIDRVVVAGYSLGGNLALKLAGDYGAAPPPQLRGVVAVSPVMDLARCVDALERRSNFIYQWNFVRGLRARMRRKDRCHPGRFDLAPLAQIRSVRAFDDRYTAPFFGYKGAADYYHRASALRVVDRITIPALIIAAADDPFVPPEPFHDAAVTGNPNIRVELSDHGGHCAFVTDPGAGTDGYWAEDRIIEFASGIVRPTAGHSDTTPMRPTPGNRWKVSTSASGAVWHPYRSMRLCCSMWTCRYAARTLLKSRGFTALAVVTLALGIGANTAVFSLLRAVFLSPLPVSDADRVVAVSERRATSGDIPISGHEYAAWKANNRTLTGLALFRGDMANLTGAGDPQKLRLLRTSANYFALLGIAAARGRVFAPGEDADGADRVVILSEACGGAGSALIPPSSDRRSP